MRGSGSNILTAVKIVQTFIPGFKELEEPRCSDDVQGVGGWREAYLGAVQKGLKGNRKCSGHISWQLLGNYQSKKIVKLEVVDYQNSLYYPKPSEKKITSKVIWRIIGPVD